MTRLQYSIRGEPVVFSFPDRYLPPGLNPESDWDLVQLAQRVAARFSENEPLGEEWQDGVKVFQLSLDQNELGEFAVELDWAPVYTGYKIKGLM